MTTKTPPAEAPAVVEPARAAPGSPSRIDWLFRDALRNRQVHPLMDLVRRYRAKDVA
ncbi:MAG: hypothetical protein M3N82_01090 [Pseudomonadota bacterium]|nr:hypothetical protein [Pseudomonadota bacterium]